MARTKKKGKRAHKKTKRPSIAACLLLAIGFAGGVAATTRITRWQAQTRDQLGAITPLSQHEQRQLRRYLNREHLDMLRSLNRIANDDELKKELDRGALTRVRTNAYYVIQGMPRSMAYLRPEAEEILATIGSRFAGELARNGLPPVRPCVTSALRTTAYQRQLTRRNGNAATHSTHEYAMAFDIHYQIFPPLRHYWTPAVIKWTLIKRLLPIDQTPTQHAFKTVLARVLISAQRQNLLRVIHERVQPCFHVTARPRPG